MNLIKKIRNWGDQHHPKWLDYFRIVLGLVLIWKGIAFALNLQAFSNLMSENNLGTATTISILAHTIIVFHLIGGLFITIGSQTRLSCLLNLPILFAAVFFVNLNQDIFSPYAELWLSSLVLIGLCCFTIEGDGKISVEHNDQQLLEH